MGDLQAMDTKEANKIMKSIAEYTKITGGKTMEVTIDIYTFDKLKKYCERMNEPMSVIATRAIKKYIDVGDCNGINSKAAISKYFSTYSVKSKREFKYRVKSNSSTVAYYSTSLIHLARLLLHKRINDTATAKRELNMHGFIVKKSFYVWFKIPDGAYYALNYLDHFAIKNGLDSYIYEEDC